MKIKVTTAVLIVVLSSAVIGLSVIVYKPGKENFYNNGHRNDKLIDETIPDSEKVVIVSVVDRQGEAMIPKRIPLL